MDVELLGRGGPARGEQQMPDRMPHLRMLTDALDYRGTPGIVALLTRDGPRYVRGDGFLRTLERLHERGRSVELLI